ncbi:MAG: hypothetical protein KKD18_04860 [Nanoarchaeota archaeon]|nr:hypothetical protein [Nanoarchaeota archaeon]
MKTTQNLDEANQGGISRITGAVIGPGGATLGDLFIVILGILIVIGGLTTLILLRKTRLRKKLDFYTSQYN